VAALIQDGNPFPENYFWQCEKVDIYRFFFNQIILFLIYSLRNFLNLINQKLLI
jgi:hypothetical protein